MRGRIWLGGAVSALLLTAGVLIFRPQYGGVALIVFALGAVAVAAFRLL